MKKKIFLIYKKNQIEEDENVDDPTKKIGIS